ncbi:uncharacterized protein TNCV_598051 [Trichonephila clavipes]|nr:uncharacterized protein TNCV_598051 [Trichonephila clavipes]
MIEAACKTKPVARQIWRSDYVVRRCWDQWIQEISFTERSDSGCPRQTSRRQDHYIVRNSRVQTTASSAAIQAQEAPSLGASVSFRTITTRLSEENLATRRPATIPCAAHDAHPSTPSFGVVPRTRKLDCSGMEPGRL